MRSYRCARLCFFLTVVYQRRGNRLIKNLTTEPIWLRMYTYAHTPPGGHADGSCGDMGSYLWHVYVTE